MSSLSSCSVIAISPFFYYITRKFVCKEKQN
nr:MAG TPA: hypothetical protein [Caudoviricetes sp.]